MMDAFTPHPAVQAIVRTLLLDCQQLLELDPGCAHAYVWAAQLVLYARWPLDQRRVVALFEEGTRRCKAAKCERAGGLPCCSPAPAAALAGKSTHTLRCPPRPPLAGWLAAAEVQHDCAMYHLRAAAGERNVAVRQAALLEAGER